MFEEYSSQIPDIKIVSLHKHWLTADSINYHLRRSTKMTGASEEKISPALQEFGVAVSTFHALAVWYALLYVVIEGYRELAIRDPKIEEILSNDENVDNLRRFRNAVFHFQEDPLTDKLFNFLNTEESEIWIKDLNSAFKAYFESLMPPIDTIESMLDEFKSTLQKGKKPRNWLSKIIPGL